MIIATKNLTAFFNFVGFIFACINTYGLLWFITKAIPVTEGNFISLESIVVNQGLILNFLISIILPVLFLIGLLLSGDRSKGTWMFQTLLIGIAFSIPYMNIPAVFFLMYWMTKKVKKQYVVPALFK